MSVLYNLWSAEGLATGGHQIFKYPCSCTLRSVNTHFGLADCEHHYDTHGNFFFKIPPDCFTYPNYFHLKGTVRRGNNSEHDCSLVVHTVLLIGSFFSPIHSPNKNIFLLQKIPRFIFFLIASVDFEYCRFRDVKRSSEQAKVDHFKMHATDLVFMSILETG